MGPSLAALYALLALHIVAGAQAQPFALLPGQYRLRFPGRMACGVSQGLLSAYRCESQRVRLTVNYRASELTAWALQPVQPGTAVLTNATRVHLVAGGRGVCPGTYATWPVGCTGAVALAPFGQAPVRQQWVVEAWGATWRLRPAACLGAYLSIPKACSGVDAMVQLQSSTAHWNAFSLFRSEDGTAVKPGDAQPPPAPSPAPSPPPVASPPPPVVPSPPPPVVPSPPPPVVPSPPLPVVPSPPPSPPPEPSPGTNVEAAVVESARWALGFEGSFRITNRNPFDILNWKLSFAVVGAGNFTWGPSDVDVTWRGALGELVPKEWLREIKAGATLEIKFGGRGAAPSDARFTQILPLVDPDNDPSLKARGVFPAKVFAPFIDATLYPTPRLLDAWEATGQKWFTLAFITADLAKKTPAWGGVIGMEKQYFVDQIRDVRLKGGDVIVSFGGAAGQELAQVVADEDALLGMYQQVVDLYRLRWIDFDIEGQACAQPESIDRRNRVLRRLQAANPGLTLSYTLPVLPAGLTADGVKLLRSCVANGVRVDVLNIMTMDYGDSAAPNPDGRMGDYAIQAAQNTYQQALEVGMSTKIGNTPMIGLNDVETETFYLADAQKLAAWARATPWVRWTAFWSIGRDKYNGEKYVSIHSSSIPQQPFDFTRAFQAVAQ